jgi:hypothetical protein
MGVLGISLLEPTEIVQKNFAEQRVFFQTSFKVGINTDRFQVDKQKRFELCVDHY